MLAEAEVFKGDRFVRHEPGRPKVEVTKEKISVRLDPDVLVRPRESGAGGTRGSMSDGRRPRPVWRPGTAGTVTVRDGRRVSMLRWLVVR